MKTNKPKAQPDTGFNAFCQAMEHYATANHALHTLQLRINTDIEDLIAGYEPQLATLIQARETAYTTIQTYCQRHKKQLFGNRRSVAFRSLTVKPRHTCSP